MKMERNFRDEVEEDFYVKKGKDLFSTKLGLYFGAGFVLGVGFGFVPFMFIVAPCAFIIYLLVRYYKK